jgi:hypothetical protein
MAKLEKIADKNSIRIGKLIAKADRIKARIEARITKLQDKNTVLGEEAAACRKTADKLNDFFA